MGFDYEPVVSRYKCMNKRKQQQKKMRKRKEKKRTQRKSLS